MLAILGQPCAAMAKAEKPGNTLSRFQEKIQSNVL